MRLKRFGLAVAICATASLGASAGPAFANHILPTSGCDSADDIPAGCFIGGGPASAFGTGAATPLASITTPAIVKPATPDIVKPATQPVPVLYVDENGDGDFNDPGEEKAVPGTPAVLVPGTPAQTVLGPQALGGNFRVTYQQGAGTQPQVDFVACHAGEHGLHIRVHRIAGTRDVDVAFLPTGADPMTGWQELTPTEVDQGNNNPQSFQTGFCVDP